MSATANGERLIERLVEVCERIVAEAGYPAEPFDWDWLIERRPDLAAELDPLLILASRAEFAEVLRRLRLTPEGTA